MCQKLIGLGKAWLVTLPTLVEQPNTCSTPSPPLHCCGPRNPASKYRRGVKPVCSSRPGETIDKELLAGWWDTQVGVQVRTSGPQKAIQYSRVT